MMVKDADASVWNMETFRPRRQQANTTSADKSILDTTTVTQQVLGTSVTESTTVHNRNLEIESGDP